MDSTVMRLQHALFAIALITLSAMTSAQPRYAEPGTTRTSDARAVSVSVTPLKPSDGSQPLQFRVVMETHAVDLDYDLASIALLRDSRGNEHRPVRWDGPRGGHHVSGVLSFGQAGAILKPGAGEIELRIAGVAGAPQRVFRWETELLE